MRFTGTGRAILVIAIALIAAGIAMGVPPVTALGAAAGATLVMAATAVVEPPAVTALRRPSAASVDRGDPATIELVFGRGTERRRRPFTVVETVDGELRAAEIPPFPSDQRFALCYDVPTGRRGLVTCGPLRLRRTDPFGLVEADRTLSDTCVISVRPRRHALSVLPFGLLRDLEGPTRAVADGSSSFHQLREYVPGDELRHVHWKTTARTGTLVVKQLVDTTRPEVVVVLDNRTSLFRSEDFEEAVEIAASVCEAIERAGFPVRLVLTDGGSEVDTDGRTVPFLDRLTQVGLADVDATRDLSESMRGRGQSLVYVTGSPSPADLSMIARLARGFRTTQLISCVANRTEPFVVPRGISGFACGSAAEFAATWTGRT